MFPLASVLSCSAARHTNRHRTALITGFSRKATVHFHYLRVLRRKQDKSLCSSRTIRAISLPTGVILRTFVSSANKTPFHLGTRLRGHGLYGDKVPLRDAVDLKSRGCRKLKRGVTGVPMYMSLACFAGVVPRRPWWRRCCTARMLLKF